jgi:hypothetical protein
MLEFAKQIGAIRGGRPDWYVLAEHLAAIAKPDLLKDPPVSKPVGRPKRETNLSWLYMDVRMMMRRRGRGCTIKRACELLAKGERPHRIPVTVPPGGMNVILPDGTKATLTPGTKFMMRGVMGNWKGKKVKTMVVDYQRARGEWKKERENWKNN